MPGKLDKSVWIKLMYWWQNQYPSAFNWLELWVQTNGMCIVSKIMALSTGVSSTRVHSRRDQDLTLVPRTRWVGLNGRRSFGEHMQDSTENMKMVRGYKNRGKEMNQSHASSGWGKWWITDRIISKWLLWAAGLRLPWSHEIETAGDKEDVLGKIGICFWDFKVLYLVRQPSVGQTHANTAERRIGKTLKLRCPKTWAQILFPVLTISVRT